MHRRVRSIVIATTVLGSAAAACSGDAESAGPTSTVPTSTTSQPAADTTTTSDPPVTSTSTTSTSTTTPPRCPDTPPLRTVDLDGDGDDAGVWIVERSGGQQLIVCAPTERRTLDLESAAWYLAVTDVEPDGIDELFIGAADIDDTRETPATVLRWLDPAGGGLRPYSDGFGRGLSVGALGSGAGCVDVDGDGDRELVSLTVDGAESTDEVVAWRRSVSTAIPGADVTDDRRGTFDRETQAAAIDLLSTFSCGDELVPLERVSPPATICEPDDAPFGSETIDLDGDGDLDRVVQKEARGDAGLRSADYGGPAIAVCLSSGATDELPVGGMGEVFGVGRGPGGLPVIWTGGTSISAAYRAAVVVIDGRLTYVDDAGTGFTFGLWDGYEGWDPDDARIGASGCGDIDGDGRQEFVQVEAVVDGDVLRWTREAWSFDGRSAAAGATDQGTRPAPQDLEAEFGGYEEIVDLAPDDC